MDYGIPIYIGTLLSQVIHFVDKSQKGGLSLGEVESLPENERKLRELEEGCLEELKMVQ